MSKKDNASIKFSLIFIVMLLISYLISSILLDNNAYSGDSNSAENEKTESLISNKKNYDQPVLIYAIALGFIGVFNMYNALEIYKKKEQIDRNFNEMAASYIEATNKLKLTEQELGIQYKDIKNEIVAFYKKTTNKLKLTEQELGIKHKDIKLDINVIKNDLEEDFKNKYENLEDNTKGQIHKQTENYKNKMKSMFNDYEAKYEAKYNDIKKMIDVTTNDFESFRLSITHDFNKHYYSYTLYSLIPDYLIDEKNRTVVESAFYWYSQKGERNDLELLLERRNKIPQGDHDLIEICDKAISEIEKRVNSDVA